MQDIDLIGTFLIEGLLSSTLPEELEMSGQRLLVRLEVAETPGQQSYGEMEIHTVPAFRIGERQARLGISPLRCALAAAVEAEAAAMATAKATADAEAAAQAVAEAQALAGAEALAVAEAEAKDTAETRSTLRRKHSLTL
jgi:hypothetical protein